MPARIGIVACSAEGDAVLSDHLRGRGARHLGAYHHPEVSMHTHPLAVYLECIDRRDWQGVGELMLSSANKLAKIGAEFLICPDTTPFIRHSATWSRGRRCPGFTSTDVVAAEARRRGFRRVGLTGTRSLVQSVIYPEKLAALDLELRSS